jgi:hypothetical protein
VNPRILHADIQEFIRKNLKADLSRLILKKSPFEGVSSKELAVQIKGMGKARDKLPTWFATDNIYYPNSRNLEQSSGEIAASYKASLIKTDTALDITGGFGVDTYYLSQRTRVLEYWETDEELAAIAAHNLKQLGVSNVSCHAGNGLKGLIANDYLADLIYIDPSRRKNDNKRVFLLADCIPDVPGNLHALFQCAPLLLVKTSPLLDLTAGLAELQHVKEIHVVAVKNEVKEVLWLLEKGFRGEPLVKTMNFETGGNQKFEFTFTREKSLIPGISEPLDYLFEPNAAIMKSGGFYSLGQQYAVCKIHRHTHLYTSDRPLEFPGRKFRVRKILPYSRSSLQGLTLKKANISTRNFPETVPRIRRKTGIGDGGPAYLFFTRSQGNGLIMIECEKI